MGLKSARDTLVERIQTVAETSADLEQLSYAGASLAKLVDIDFDVLPTDGAYGIGKPGEFGFGQSAIPDELLPAGFIKLNGHDDVASPNYGNVMDAQGSIFIYRPKFYYKMTGNVISIADKPTTGYVMPYAFNYHPNGFLQFAYLAGNEGGKMVSKPMLDPLSTNGAHNPIGNLIVAPANNYGGFVDACAGNGYTAMTIFEWQLIGLIALAQSQSGAGAALVAYNDVLPHFPKGNLASALKDYNDSSVTFTASGYSNCALTGSGSNVAKTTDNGQSCGVKDVTGNMWKIGIGLTYLAKTGATCDNGDTAVAMPNHGLAVDDVIYFGGTPSSGSTYNTAAYTVTAVSDGDNFTVGTALERAISDTDGVYSPRYFRILKPSVHPSTLTASNLLDESNYDLLNLTGLIDGNSGTVYFGNGANQVLNFSTDTNSTEYKAASCGIPTADGVNGSGTTDFGNDYIYKYLRNGLVPVVGGYWYDSSYAGVFACALSDYSSNSSSGVGGFASVSL